MTVILSAYLQKLKKEPDVSEDRETSGSFLRNCFKRMIFCYFYAYFCEWKHENFQIIRKNKIIYNFCTKKYLKTEDNRGVKYTEITKNSNCSKNEHKIVQTILKWIERKIPFQYNIISREVKHEK